MCFASILRYSTITASPPKVSCSLKLQLYIANIHKASFSLFMSCVCRLYPNIFIVEEFVKTYFVNVCYNCRVIG